VAEAYMYTNMCVCVLAIPTHEKNKIKKNMVPFSETAYKSY